MNERFHVDDLWQPSQPLPGRGVLSAIAERCGRLWDMPHFASMVRIVYNPRLRTTLGRALLTDRQVELNTRLLREHPGELVATLVHELAHIAVEIRYGKSPPHGRAFRTLMRALNLSAESTHCLPVSHLRPRRKQYLYLHRCSDCGYSFISKVVRRNYYCLDCGPEMTWDIFRAVNDAEGRKKLKHLQSRMTSAT